ncbi:MAG: hypothetical protein ACOYN0_16785 [Phycisphaerales bacterium]
MTTSLRNPAVVAGAVALLTAVGTANAGPVFGNLLVTQNDTGNTAASVSGLLATNSGGTYAGGTRGDFALRFSGATEADDISNGMLMASIRQNGRSNGGSTPNVISNGLGYATPAIQVRPNTGTGFTGVGTSINLSNANITGAASGAEWNADQSYGYFPYSEFLGGWATNGTHDDSNTAGINNGDLNAFAASTPGLTIGTGATDPGTFNVFDSSANAGVYTLRLGNLNAARPGLSSVPATSQNGVLLVVGGKNEDNYALSEANADGSFSMICKDNGTNGTSYENDPVAFTYVPLSHPDFTAIARVDGEGDTIVGSGIYTVTKGGTGEWYISAPGVNDLNSVLLISPEGGVGGGNRADNIWNFQWDDTNTRWVVQSRDLPGNATTDPGLQNMAANEAAFSFVIAPIPAPGAAALLGLGGLLAARRRR